MRNRICAILAMLSVFSVFLVGCNRDSEPVAIATPNPVAGPTVSKRDPVMATYDLPCEDSETLPCVMRDDDGYYLVLSWEPFNRLKLYDCGSEDGGPYLPCVWDAEAMGNHKHGEGTARFYVFTEPFK